MESNYYHNKQTVEEYINMAKDVNGKKLIAKLKDFLPLNSKLLEIGSGPGSDLAILNNNFEVTGSDYSSEFLQRLSKSYPDTDLLMLDAITLLTENKYNGIYSNKVLHHLNNDELKQSIQRQYEILEKDGIICHSFWKGTGDELYNGMFVNYQIENSLNELFVSSFNILYLESYKEFEEDDSLLLIAQKI